jgi:hypothetical protein
VIKDGAYADPQAKDTSKAKGHLAMRRERPSNPQTRTLYARSTVREGINADARRLPSAREVFDRRNRLADQVDVDINKDSEILCWKVFEHRSAST